jgi:molecular chaperone GrpE
MNESKDTKIPPVEPDVNERITELEQQLKRVAADFDNYRKRTETEKKLSFQLAQAQTLLELAPVLDNFRRATIHLPDNLKDDKWVTGVLYIEKQLEQIFSEFGVEKIKTVGEMFNPAIHEAVSHEANDQPENTIIAEIESGYTLQGQVLKPAKVKVSSGEPKDQ